MVGGMETGEAITLYLTAIEGEKAWNTLKATRNILKQLPDCELSELDADRLIAWRKELAERPMLATSVNMYMHRVRGFLSWCVDRELIDKLPKVESLRPQQQRKLRLTTDQIRGMIVNARHPRDRAMIAVASEWLLRASEITALRVGDLNSAIGMADVRVMKKKGEWAFDEMVISRPLGVELGRWLDYYYAAAPGVGAGSFLFPAITSRLEGACSRYEVNPSRPCTNPERVIGYAFERAGIVRDRRGFHDIRRSMARLRYDDLVAQQHPDPLGVVKGLLHHTDRRTTELYIGTNAERDLRNQAMRSATWLSVLPTPTVAETKQSGLAPVVRLRP
jgi:integrase